MSTLKSLVEQLRTITEAMIGLGGGSSPSWTGFYGISQYSQGEPILQPAAGFPFKSMAAVKVWKFIQKVAVENPELKVIQLIKMAADQSGVSMIEIPPEDSRLLELAANFLVTGRSQNQVAQKTPGLRTPSDGGEGHVLAKRGFP